MFQETFIVQLPDLCPLSMYAFLHVCTILTLSKKHTSVHARFSSKQTHDFVHGHFPLHEHISYCKKSADISPSKYTGCSESFPFCHLYSNGDEILGFATCDVVQIWV